MLIHILEVFHILLKSLYTNVISYEGDEKMTWQVNLSDGDRQLMKQNQRLLQHLNTSRLCPAEVNQLVSEVIGRPLTADTEIRLPFYTDFGRNIKIGKNVFINCNVMMSDIAGITIGKNVEIDSGVSLLTNSYVQNKLVMAPIKIKDDVKIGARVIILPGVTISEGSIIEAGSIVSKNIK